VLSQDSFNVKLNISSCFFLAGEVSAIKILSHHINDITSFIDKKLRAK